MSAPTLADFLSALYTSPLSVRETIDTVSFHEKHLPEILYDYERISAHFRALNTFSVKLNGMCAELNAILAAAGGQCTIVPRVTSFQPRQHRLTSVPAPIPVADDADIICTSEPPPKEPSPLPPPKPSTSSSRKTAKTPAKLKSELCDFNSTLVGSLLRLNFAEQLASDINRAHELFEAERENDSSTQLVIDQATEDGMELPFPELDLGATDPRIQKMIDIVDEDEAIWDSLFSVLPGATSMTKTVVDPCKTPKPLCNSGTAQVTAAPSGATYVRALNFEEQPSAATNATPAVVDDDVELVAEVSSSGDDPLARFAERCAKKERRARQPPTILRHRSSPGMSPSSVPRPPSTGVTPLSVGKRKRKVDPMLSPQSNRECDVKRPARCDDAESLQALASLAAAAELADAASTLSARANKTCGDVARIEGLIRIEEEGVVENSEHENFEGLMALFTIMTQQQRPEPVPPPQVQQQTVMGSAQRRIELTPAKIDAVLRKLHRL